MVGPLTEHLRGRVAFFDPFQALSMRDPSLPIRRSWILSILLNFDRPRNILNGKWTTAVVLLHELNNKRVTVLHSISHADVETINAAHIFAESMVKALLSEQHEKVSGIVFQHYALWRCLRLDIEYDPMIDICNAYGLFCQMCIWEMSQHQVLGGDALSESVIQHLHGWSCSFTGARIVKNALTETTSNTLVFLVLCVIAETQSPKFEGFQHGIMGTVQYLEGIFANSSVMSPEHEKRVLEKYQVAFQTPHPDLNCGSTCVPRENGTMVMGFHISGKQSDTPQCLFLTLMNSHGYGVVADMWGRPFRDVVQENVDDFLNGFFEGDRIRDPKSRSARGRDRRKNNFRIEEWMSSMGH